MPISFLVRATGLCCLIGLVASLPTAPSVQAKPYMPQIEQVPVSRLIDNLEGRLKTKPDDFEATQNLARLHGMAYALKTDTAPVDKTHPERGPYWQEDKAVPFSLVVKASNSEKKKQADAHLLKAKECYEKAHKLDPGDLRAWLGLAWITEQQGKKQEAIKEYRELLKRAWIGQGASAPVAVEATEYLTPLLDAKKDSAEIATLKARCANIKALPRHYSPIVVPLRDHLEPAELEDRSARVAFDADGSGHKRRWTWITKDAAWLVYDPQAKREITSALQLFGNVTFWLFWENGYQALSALDDNHDGWLTGNELQGLALWNDANGNGICEPGEVKPLSAYGIEGICCRYQIDSQHPDRIAWSPVGVRYRDGKTRSTYDLILHSRGPADDESR